MGGSAPKVKPTAAERQNAANALSTLRRHQEFVLPLEMEEIRDAYDKDTNAARQGILNRGSQFSAMQAEASARAQERAMSTQTGTSLSSAGNVMRRHAAGTSGMQGAAGALAQAEISGEQQRLDKKFGLLQTGQGVSKQYAQGLGDVASDSTSVAINKMQADEQVRAARAKAIGDVAMTAGVMGGTDWARGGDPTIPFEQQGLLGRYRSANREYKAIQADPNAATALSKDGIPGYNFDRRFTLGDSARSMWGWNKDE